jgi:hypothetical protein
VRPWVRTVTTTTRARIREHTGPGCQQCHQMCTVRNAGVPPAGQAQRERTPCEVVLDRIHRSSTAFRPTTLRQHEVVNPCMRNLSPIPPFGVDPQGIVGQLVVGVLLLGRRRSALRRRVGRPASTSASPDGRPRITERLYATLRDSSSALLTGRMPWATVEASIGGCPTSTVGDAYPARDSPLRSLAVPAASAGFGPDNWWASVRL